MTLKDKIVGKWNDTVNYVKGSKHYPTAKKYAPHAGIAGVALAAGLALGQCSEPVCEEPDTKPKVTDTTPAPAPKPIIPRIAPTTKPSTTLCDVVVDGYVKKKTNKQCLSQKIREVGRIPIKNHDPHKNVLNCDVLNVFYTTNGWTLYTNDLNDIATYAQSLEPGSKVVIEGHADYRGPEGWNDKLALERSLGAEEVLARNGKGLKIQRVVYGEKEAKHTAKKDLYKDRKVRISRGKNVIQQGLDVLVADKYLIDQSSSMGESLPSGISKWKAVQDYKFAKDKDVYTFTDAARTCGTKLSQENPIGNTPLYDSLSELIRKTPKGETITILTDGADNTSRTAGPFEVVSLAQRKDIKINVLDLSGEKYSSAIEVAKETGGKIYKVAK